MQRLGLLAIIMFLAAAASGCNNAQIKAQQRKNRDLASKNAGLLGQIAGIQQNLDDQQTQLQGLKIKEGGYIQAIGLRDRRIADLERQGGSGTDLIDDVTKEKLRQIASQYSGQLQYDEKLSLIRVTEAINFGSGRTNITRDAKNALRAVAGALKDLDGVVFRVDGHTDSDRVLKSRKLNIDNMFLSTKRAHAVWVELAAGGMPTEKMYTAGHSFNKLIMVDGKESKKASRRVEIVILPGKK